jgi:hypothetical protein
MEKSNSKAFLRFSLDKISDMIIVATKLYLVTKNQKRKEKYNLNLASADIQEWRSNQTQNTNKSNLLCCKQHTSFNRSLLHMKLQLLYSFLLLLALAATAPDNKGTEFIVAFPPNYETIIANLALFLSAEEACTGTSIFVVHYVTFSLQWKLAVQHGQLKI